ncbi:hypothetical protein [Pseudoduganella sp. OTU4001]|uniref:hypothetical protein n=1 Tax=Pseudoduganella sp. OTU4001 TaxID=3043854 RepID=UPI00313C3EAB
MTMPIQFDTAQYIKRLVEAGILHEHAEALADALLVALSQPVAGGSDLAIWRAEIQAMFTRSEAAMKEWVRAEIARSQAEMKEWVRAEITARLRPIYWLLGVVIVQQTIIMAKLFL